MKPKRVAKLLMTLIMLALLFSACAGQPKINPTLMTNLITTPSITPSTTFTFTPTDAPTLTPTFTPYPIQNIYAGELFPLAKHIIGIVHDFAFSPDGRWLALGVAGGVFVYDSNDLSLPPRFLGANINATVIEFSPDGQILAGSGQYLNYIYLWDTSTWEQTKIIGMDYYAARMKNITFSPDNNLVSISESAAEPVSFVKFWNIKTGKLIRTLSSNNLQSISFSPDGRTAAAGTWDGTITLWDWTNGELIDSISADGDYVDDLAFSPDGTMLVSTSGNFKGKKGESLTIWDASTRQKIRSLPGSESYFSSISFSPSGETLATCCYKYNIVLWDPITGDSKNELPGEGKVAFSSNGKSLAYGGGFAVTLWDEGTQQEIQKITDFSGELLIAFTPHGNSFVTFDDAGGMMMVRDLTTMKVLHTFPADHPGYGRSKFSPDGEIFATAVESDNAVSLWDASSWEAIGTFSDVVSDFDISPNNKVLATLGRDLVLWDIGTGQNIKTLECGRWMADCDAVAFSPDGRIIVVSSYTLNRPLVKIFDASTGGEVSAFESQTGRVADIVFSPEGKFFATIDRASSIITLWNANNYEQIRTFGGHALGGYDIYRNVPPVFSPDGRVLASMVDDRINLWNIETGDLIYTLYVNLGTTTFSFKFDSTILVTGERYSGSILYWGFGENLTRYPSPLVIPGAMPIP